MPLTDNDIIKDRVRVAFEEYETEAQKYRTYCAQYKDSSTESRGSYSDPDDEPEVGDSAEGGIMHLRTNIQTKLAFTTMNEPDLFLTMRPNTPPGYQEIAKAALMSAWDALDLTIQTRRSRLNRNVGGLGILTYRLDERGYPDFDCVRKCDFAPDPHVTNWKKLRYATLKIKMPRDDFEKNYPGYAKLIESSPRLSLSGATRRKNAVDLKLYWDMGTECVLYGTTIIDKDINHYGKPPFLFDRGDLSPDSIHDTGDYENAMGLQAGLTILSESLHNQAQHGGGLNLYNGDVIPKRKLAEGRQNGWIDAGAFMDRAIKRIEAEPLNPALLQAYQMEREALDEAVGVSAPQRGGTSDAKFATDLVIRANQSQGRADHERTAYERFCAEVAKTLRFLMIEFSSPATPDAWVVVEALEYVADIKVIERSTVYQDPIASRNDAVQLFDKSVQAAGIGVPVDMVKIYLHLLRSFDLRDVEQYLLDQNAMAMMMQQSGAMGGAAATVPGQPAQAPPMGGGQLPPGGAPPQMAAMGAM